MGQEDWIKKALLGELASDHLLWITGEDADGRRLLDDFHLWLQGLSKKRNCCPTRQVNDLGYSTRMDLGEK